MSAEQATCPDPLARAPRAGGRASLLLAPPSLQGALSAVVCRDTRGLTLSPAQRLNHFPATPLVCLSWFQGMDIGLIDPHASGARWQPLNTALTLSGSQSRPLVSWSPGVGRAGMACFPADVAHALFGVDLAALLDRFAPAQVVLGAQWQGLLDGLLASADAAAALAVLEHHLAPRWQALCLRADPAPSLRQIGRHWVQRLAWLAFQWRDSHSTRQIERRIKHYSGRSLREWRALVQTEGALFAALERHAAGLPLDLAGLAQEQGFADQAHLSRATKRITGFAPAEFARRFVEDESFWVYRLWV